jgi:hypothetical protein
MKWNNQMFYRNKNGNAQLNKWKEMKGNEKKLNKTKQSEKNCL